MVHVGVAFQAEQLWHLHRTDLASAAQVVTQQVHDHQVFRAVLGAVAQRLGIAGVFCRVGRARAGALDRAGLHLPLADADEAFWRKAQQCAAVGQLLVARERRRTGLAQGLVGAPGVALARCAEALGQVDLVAIAGLNVALYLIECCLVLPWLQITRHGGEQAEIAACSVVGVFKQGDEALALVISQLGVEHQLAGAMLVVGHQRPAIQPKLGVGQAEVIRGEAGQVLQASAEVVAEVADQAAGKWQLDTTWQLRRAQLFQAGAQPLQEGPAIFVGQHLQVLQRPGAEQVEAAALGAWAGAVEQDRPGRLAQAGEVRGGVGLIGQGVERTGRHQCGRRCKSEEGDCRPAQEMRLAPV
ncbi:hypothetical protein D3C78_785140 [compost metagenome]